MPINLDKLITELKTQVNEWTPPVNEREVLELAVNRFTLGMVKHSPDSFGAGGVAANLSPDEVTELIAEADDHLNEVFVEDGGARNRFQEMSDEICLSRVEFLVYLGAYLNRIGSLPQNLQNVGHMMAALELSPGERVEVATTLDAQGDLITEGLIVCERNGPVSNWTVDVTSEWFEFISGVTDHCPTADENQADDCETENVDESQPTFEAGSPVFVEEAPQKFNTRKLSEVSEIYFGLTGMEVPPEVLRRAVGRRYVTRNGSVVQLVSVPRPRGMDSIALCVVTGGHGVTEARGDGIGSSYHVIDDGTFACEDRAPHRLHDMDVVAEVLEG